MSDYAGGTVFLDVIPSFRNLQKDIAKQAQADAKAYEKAYNDELGRSQPKAPTPQKEQSKRDGEASGGAFADSFKRKVEAAARSLPPLRVGAATSEAEQQLRDLRQSLDDLSSQRVGVDLDAGTALAEVQRIQSQLERLGRESPDIQVRLDSAAATAQLASVQAAIAAVDGRDVDIDANVDTDRARGGLLALNGLMADSPLDSFSGRLTAVGVAGAALGPMIVPAAAAAAAAIVGIGAALTATLAGAGVLALGFSGVGDAVKALDKAQADSGKNAARNAAAASSAAQQQASAARQVESAEASLANTRANAAAATERANQRVAQAQTEVTDAVEEGARRITDAEQKVQDATEAAAERVADARQRVQDVTDQGADRISSALRRQEDAERSLADAQEDARDAQEALTEAREREQRRVADLSLDVVSAGLRQRQAALDVMEAQKRLNETVADPKADGLARQQAQLRYEQSQQQLTEIGVRYQRLQAEKAAADKAGIDGSDAVIDAQKRVSDAVDASGRAQLDAAVAASGVTDARSAADRASAEAQADLAKAQRESARQVADARIGLADTESSVAERIASAQQAVTEATTAAAEQQRSATFSVGQAMRSLEGAQASAATAGAAGFAATSASADELADAMGALSPVGQEFALFLYSLKPAFDGLRAAAQGGLLPGVQAAIEGLLPALPAVTGFVGSLASVLGDLAIQASQALLSPAWASFFDYLSAEGGNLLTQVATGVGYLALALANLMVAFAPLTDAFLTGFAEMMAGFAQWAADLSGSDGFTGFVDYLTANGPLLGQMFVALGQALVQLVLSAAPFAPIVLSIVTALLQFVAAIPVEIISGVVLAVLGLVAAFQYILPAIAVVVPIVESLWGLITGLVAVIGGSGSAGLAGAVSALGGPVGLIIGGIILLGAALVALWVHSETFRDIVTGAFTAVGDAGVWLWENALKPAFEGIGAVISFVWDNVLVPIFEAYKFYFQNILGPVVMFLWNDVIKPAWTGIQIAIQIAWVAIQLVLGAFELFIRGVLAPVFTFLWQTIVKPAFEGIGSVIELVWRTIVKPVFEALGGFIEDNVAPAFQRGVDAIAKAWDGIREAAKGPVRFVVETVLNNGIIKGFNTLADLVPGVDKIDPIKLPEGFARGGILPGTSTWRDGDDQLVPMRRGEGVAVSEAMAVPALRQQLLTWNAIGLAGGTPALTRWADRSGFARGGVIGRIPGTGDGPGDALSNVTSGVKALLGNPLGALRKIVDDLLSQMPGGNTALGQVVSAVPKVLAEKLAGLFGGGGDAGDGVAAAMPTSSGRGYQWQTGIVQDLFPQARVTSGFRPGAITVSGNRSFHALGRAVDIAPPTMGIFNKLLDVFPDSAELIYSPAGARQLKNGRSHLYTGAVRDNHYDHVHWAYDNGGYLPPGVTQVFNGTGKPEPVFTSSQWSTLETALAQKARAPQGISGPLIHQPVTIRETVDWELLQRQQSYELEGTLARLS